MTGNVEMFISCNAPCNIFHVWFNSKLNQSIACAYYIAKLLRMQIDASLMYQKTVDFSWQMTEQWQLLFNMQAMRQSYLKGERMILQCAQVWHVSAFVSERE